MNRRSFLYGSAVLGAVRPSPAAPAKDSLLEKVAEAALSMQRHSWEQGILAQAFLDMEDRERVILMAKSAMVEKAADGRLAAIGGGATDPAMGGTAYWRAAEWTGDPQMQQAARGLLEFVLKKAPRAADGTCYHVFNAPEMWSDSFYTTPPFLAATGHYDEAILQIDGLRKRLWSPEKKLLSHIWDDGRQQFKHKAFWGVGNGWAAAGITRVIAALPAARQADRERLSAFLRNCWMDASLTSAPTACSTMCWTSPRALSRPTWRRCWLSASTPACQGAGCRPATARPRTACAPPPAPRWTNSASCRESAAHPLSTMRGSRRKARRSSS